MNDWKSQLQDKAADLNIKRRPPSVELLGAARHYVTCVSRLTKEVRGNNATRPSPVHYHTRELSLTEAMIQALNRFRGLCDLEGYDEMEIVERADVVATADELRQGAA